MSGAPIGDLHGCHVSLIPRQRSHRLRLSGQHRSNLGCHVRCTNRLSSARTHFQCAFGFIFLPTALALFQALATRPFGFGMPCQVHQSASLQGHIYGIFSVAFSLDGTHVVSGSDDQTLRIWDCTSDASMDQQPLILSETSSLGN